MLYVIDNGGHYSDHVIRFVAVQPREEPVLDLILEVFRLGREDYRVIFKAPSVVWLDPKARITFLDYAKNLFFYIPPEKEAEALVLRDRIKKAWIDAEIQEPLPYELMFLGD